nr:hypothetical protein GOBAR_AA35343 [Ipomoea batatas]
MPPRKKSIPKKPTPKPYHLDLEVARHFGLYDEVAAMVTLTVWRYLLMEFEEDTYVDLLLEFSADELSDLMGFKDVQQIHEEELGNRCAQVANAQALWEELTRSKTLFKSSKVKSTLFIKKEHKFMHYVLSHSICGRYDSTSSVSPADLLCLYGMITIRRVHMGVVVGNLFINQQPPKGLGLYLGPYLTRIIKQSQRVRLT